MNVERMMAVRDRIKAHPEILEMEYLHRGFFRRKHCIFGLIQTMYSPRWRDRVLGGQFAWNDMPVTEIMSLVGLQYWDGRSLYHYYSWPERWREMYQRGQLLRSDSLCATAAVGAIDEFIDAQTYLKNVDAA